MKANWKRNILGGLCLTSVAFVFQACYGTMQDFGNDLLIEGKVVSKNTGLPIQGIKVSVFDGNNVLPQYEHTDVNGNFSFYTIKLQNAKIRFEDIDANENGSFATKDTVITIVNDQNEALLQTIELENK